MIIFTNIFLNSFWVAQLSSLVMHNLSTCTFARACRPRKCVAEPLARPTWLLVELVVQTTSLAGAGTKLLGWHGPAVWLAKRISLPTKLHDMWQLSTIQCAGLSSKLGWHGPKGLWRCTTRLGRRC